MMRTAVAPYPDSQSEPVTDLLHGISVTDPYRWLEDRNLPRTQKWVAEQIAYARRYLGRLPGRERLRNRIRELLSVDSIDTPLKVRDRILFLQRSSEQEQQALVMRAGLDGTETTLLDPVNYFQSAAKSVGILSGSGDGKLLAFSVREGGEDFYGIRILNLDRQEILSDSLPRGTCRGFVFAKDSGGFYYSHESAVGSRSNQGVYFHRLGTSPDNDEKIFAAGEGQRFKLNMVGSASTPYLGFALSRFNATRTRDFYIQHTDRQSPPRLVLANMPGKLIPWFSKDYLFCLHQAGNDNGRILRLDLEKDLQIADWHTIVPETNARMDDFVLCGGTLFVRYIENAECRVQMFAIGGQPLGVLPTPAQGTIRLFRPDPQEDLLFYRFSSLVHPPAIYCYSPQTKANRLWSSPKLTFDTSSWAVSKTHCISKDSTEIPIQLVSGPCPGPQSRAALLTAYGGFANSLTSEFSILGALLVEKGCLFAVASVRGGAEYGEQWHQAAKRNQRQRAIDDFLSASEWLIQNQGVSAERLGIAGGSNGGLLVAAAMVQRPELFRATVCLGPLLDMIRYHLFDSANEWEEEFGSSEDSGDFQALLAYSPYHQVKPRTSYPAVLFVSGDADSRCNPMHVRKMTARLQAATSSGYPVLVDYRTEFGHTPAQPLQTRIELLTDRLSFLCAELGLRV